MCGIVGIADRDGVVAREVLETMRDTMFHRGPDDAGTWWSADGCVGLGHRRLSIIDLTPGGHQPMCDATGECWITFNGEIYNYRELRESLEQAGYHFHTSSDTEVLLAAYNAWGTDCLQRLQGMFAFGLWDGRRRELFLARDRVGEKPLFFQEDGGRLLFASELKALMAYPGFPRRVDPTALHYYLAFGYVPGGLCILRGVRKLPAAHAMVYQLDAGTSREWAYWELPATNDARGRSEEDLLDELEVLLRDSVRRQMMSDVPLGILLSGGTDSSLVTAVAAQAASRTINTFTVTFPGYGGYDEAPHARLVAERFATHHVEIEADAVAPDILYDMAVQYDQPIADYSMIPMHLLSRLVRRHVTVALGGDGGDELFGGYLQHRWIGQCAAVSSSLPPVAADPLYWLADHLMPTGLRGRNLVLAMLDSSARSVAQFNTMFSPRQRLKICALDWPGDTATPQTFRMALADPFSTPLLKLTALDFRTYLTDNVLVKTDRASMLNSLECRAPWLDHRLVEFAFGAVPDRAKVSRQQGKILLARLARRLLPPEFNITRKQGFTPPLREWLKDGDWAKFLRDVLHDADPRFFRQGALRGLLREQGRGLDNTTRLFGLAIFELWRRHYHIEP
jgi:asparagine synthase (glutamine-hydrolysing)